jgi:lysophospholipase L1-like esterase
MNSLAGNFAVAVAGLIVIYATVMALRLWLAVRIIRRVAAVTQPYNRALADAPQHVLVLGDSTMFGSGVKERINTMGGRLGRKFPQASVETLAVDGARVRDLAGQLERAKYSRYDLIMVGVGGNDVVRLTDLDNLARDLAAFLERARRRSGKIIVVHCVNLGNIGFFWPPLSWLFDYRTRWLSETYAQVTRGMAGVHYVNFYRPRGADHYTAGTRARFITEDGFHPSDYANGYFFELIEKEVGLSTLRGYIK